VTALNDFIDGERDAFANATPKHDASRAYLRGYHTQLELLKLIKVRNEQNRRSNRTG